MWKTKRKMREQEGREGVWGLEGQKEKGETRKAKCLGRQRIWNEVEWREGRNINDAGRRRGERQRKGKEEEEEARRQRNKM